MTPLGLLKVLSRKPKMLNVGDQAPEFSVLDHTGKRRALSDYRGKNVVLWFYPKADTPG
jgi:thioredoxin-dependent peroxiredoxin